VADDSSAPLPRRVPGTNRHGPGSEQETRPAGPAALPEDLVRRIRVALDAARSEASLQEDAPGPEAADRAMGPTSVPPWESGPSKGPEPPAAITEEITVRPVTADRPEPAVIAPTDPEPMPALRQDERARRAKPLARRIRPSARAPKPAPPHRPPPSPGPVPQMAPMFPPEPAPEEITIRPLTPVTPEPDRRARNIGWIILVLVFIVIVALIFLL
jgi:hypothetical protein